jgi:hypothetical protein
LTNFIATYWPIVVSLASLIATLVVIWYNWTSVRKARLEIEKLKRDLADRRSNIHIPTLDEIDKYGRRTRIYPKIMLLVAVSFVASSLYYVHFEQENKSLRRLTIPLGTVDSLGRSMGVSRNEWDSLTVSESFDSSSVKSELESLSVSIEKVNRQLNQLRQSTSYKRIEKLESMLDSLETRQSELEWELWRARVAHDTARSRQHRQK